LTLTKTDRQTNKQTNKQTDRQAGRQAAHRSLLIIRIYIYQKPLLCQKDKIKSAERASDDCTKDLSSHDVVL
jgi:hypothetical protein